jgi:hypothetical protein
MNEYMPFQYDIICVLYNMTELLRFYEDLGIIANKGTEYEKDENLIQGQQYMEHRRYCNRNVHSKSSLMEGFGLLKESYVVTSLNKNAPPTISYVNPPTPPPAPQVPPVSPAAPQSSTSSASPQAPQSSTSSAPPQAPQAPQAPPVSPAAPTSSASTSSAQLPLLTPSAPPKPPQNNVTPNINNTKMQEPAPTARASTTASAPAPAPVASSADSCSPLNSNLKNGLDNTNSYGNAYDTGINLDATTFQPINGKDKKNEYRKTIEARKEYSVLENRSVKYHYIAWLLFAIFIVWAIFSLSTFSFSGINFSAEFQPAQDHTNVISSFVLIFLFFVAIYLFNQFNSTSIKTTVKIYDNSNKK